jgi:large subunit ribosomal protein L25
MAKKKAGHQKVELKAEQREVTGRKVKLLRESGIMPAVLYGKGQPSISLQVPVKTFDATLKQAGESTLVYLQVGDQSYPTIIHDVSRHPLSGLPIHADFYKVRLDEKITASVPVVFVGESPAVKDGGIFVRTMNEVEVEALPADLPHEVTIDISGLMAIGDQITLKDIKVPSAVVIGNEDEIIASIIAAKTEEELAAELAAPTTDISAVEEIKPEPKEEEVADEAAPAAAEPAKEE